MTLRARLEAQVKLAMTQACAREMRWGRDDCALWCADILQGVLGYDAAASFRGSYRSRRGAHRVLGRKGLGEALRKVARKHRWVRIPAAYAQPGDIGLTWTLVPGSTKPVLATAICCSQGWFVARNERGVTGLPASKIALCWSIDRRDVTPVPGVRMSFPRISSRPDLSPRSSVMHEPVSATIGLAIFNAGLASSVGAALAAGSFIVSAGIGLGVSYAASLLAPKPSGAGAFDTGSFGESANDVSVRYTEKQSTPSKRVIVGSAYVGGALFFEQTVAPYLYVGMLINHGEIDSVETIWIGANQLSFSSLSFNTVLTPLAVSGTPDYATYLRCSLRKGTKSQNADTLLAADFPTLSASFCQKGIATAVFRYHFGGTDPNSAATFNNHNALWGQVQRPNAYLLVRGVKVYDPRDPTQRLDDESTWKWSNNASLIQAYYLTRDWGGRISIDKIDWAKVAEAAAYDDELIGCKDGTFIKRHTIDGVITLNQKPSEILPSLLTANRGAVLQRGGKYWVSSSKPLTPIAAIHDAILTGGIEIRAAKPKRDLINKLQVRFIAKEQEYQTVDGPIRDEVALQDEDQEVLPGTLTLPFTLDHRRAQRLQKLFLLTSRLGRSITCRVDISLLADLDDELIGQAVTVASDLFPAGNGTYRVSSVGFSEDYASLDLTLEEYDSSIEGDYHPLIDEQDFTLQSAFTS